MIQNQLDLPQAVAAKSRLRLRPRRVVLRPIGYTISSELELKRALYGILRGAAKLVRRVGMPIALSAKKQLTPDQMLVMDTVQGVGVFTALFRQYIANNLPQYNSLVRSVLQKEETRYRKSLTTAVKASTGIDIEPVLRSRDVGDLVEASVLEHVELIRGMTDELAKRVSTVIIREAKRGTRANELAKILTEQFGWAQSRSQLIARDQLASFNSGLNKARQKQLGIDKYVWSTSLDERVRPLHADREGKTFSWDDPPSDGHPGEPINCRCVARAVIET